MPIPLHPALIHLPIGLAVVLPLIALALAVEIRRDALPRRAWWSVAGLQAILVASAITATFSGERDGERAEATIAKATIEQHEEAGEALAWASGTALALACVALALKERPAHWLRLATVAAGVGVLGLAFRAGHSGGALVFQYGANVNKIPPASSPALSEGDPP
jgi:uncharacterized membrane protein